MPLYEVTLEQEYAGQQIINRWNFQSGEIPSGQSGALLAVAAMGFAPYGDIDAFWEGSIAFDLIAAQNTATQFVQVIAKNLYSVTDFYTYAFPPGTVGTNGGTDTCSPVVAAGFSSDRTRSDIRRAQKRFVGLTESDIAPLGILTTAAQTLWQQLGTDMGNASIIPVGAGTVSFTPYVFGREKYVVPESGKDAYRYYPTEAEQLEHIALITQFTLKPEVRTQTSRQYGRGS